MGSGLRISSANGGTGRGKVLPQQGGTTAIAASTQLARASIGSYWHAINVQQYRHHPDDPNCEHEIATALPPPESSMLLQS